MAYSPKSRFTGDETPQELARKINDELLRISRSKSASGALISTGGASGVAVGGSGTVTIVQEAPLFRHFLFMGA
jgi:hypothetical protein